MNKILFLVDFVKYKIVCACARAVCCTKVELKVIQSMLCDRLLYPNAWYSRLVGNYCWLWFPHEFGHLWLCSCRFSLSFIYTPCILMRRVYCVRWTMNEERHERQTTTSTCVWKRCELRLAYSHSPLCFVVRRLSASYSLWSIVAGRCIVSRCRSAHTFCSSFSCVSGHSVRH